MATALSTTNPTEVANLQHRLHLARMQGAEKAEEVAVKAQKKMQALSDKYAHQSWVQRIARYVGALVAGFSVSMLDRIKDMLPAWLSDRVPDSLIPALVGAAALVVGMWTENEAIAAAGDGALIAALGLFTSGLIEGGV